MPLEDVKDDEIVFIRDLLSDLAVMAMNRGDRTLAYLIGMACLHAWEVECKITRAADAPMESELPL